jgi:hypothetical protein
MQGQIEIERENGPQIKKFGAAHTPADEPRFDKATELYVTT